MRCHACCCSRRPLDIRPARLAKPPSVSASTSSSPRIAATCSTIPGATRPIAFAFTTRTLGRGHPRRAHGAGRSTACSRVGDRPTAIAARVAEALGLPGHPPGAAGVARNKQLTRERLRDAGLPAPWFVPSPHRCRTRVPRFARLVIPCVIKPLSLSGSRGVMRADDPAGVRRRLHTGCARCSGRPNPARERRRRARARARRRVHRRATSSRSKGCCSTATLHVLAHLRQARSARRPVLRRDLLRDAVARRAGCAAAISSTRCGAPPRRIGLEHGPVHAECRVNEHGVFVLEVAARPIGGLCARALRFSGSTSRRSASAHSLRGAAASACARRDTRTAGRARRGAPA